MVNMHSVKNRFLMRIKNVTAGVYRRYWLPMTLRDLVVIGGSIFWEPASLAAFWHVAQCLPRALARRPPDHGRRRLSDDALAEWFSFDPVALPASPAGEARPALQPAPQYVPDVA